MVAGKLVIDVMNYWPPVDGVQETFEDPRYGSSEIVQHRKTRGFALPTKESFLSEIGPQGALYVGSPETVAQKIAQNLTTLGATRFDLKYAWAVSPIKRS